MTAGLVPVTRRGDSPPACELWAGDERSGWCLVDVFRNRFEAEGTALARELKSYRLKVRE